MSEFEQLCLALDWWRSEAEHSAAELRKMGDERAALARALLAAYEFIVSTHPQDDLGCQLKDEAMKQISNALAALEANHDRD